MRSLIVGLGCLSQLIALFALHTLHHWELQLKVRPMELDFYLLNESLLFQVDELLLDLLLLVKWNSEIYLVLLK